MSEFFWPRSFQTSPRALKLDERGGHHARECQQPEQPVLGCDLEVEAVGLSIPLSQLSTDDLPVFAVQVGCHARAGADGWMIDEHEPG